MLISFNTFFYVFRAISLHFKYVNNVISPYTKCIEATEVLNKQGADMPCLHLSRTPADISTSEVIFYNIQDSVLFFNCFCLAYQESFCVTLGNFIPKLIIGDILNRYCN